MINVDRILELKKRINKIAEELLEMQASAESAKASLELNSAYDYLDLADIALGKLT